MTDPADSADLTVDGLIALLQELSARGQGNDKVGVPFRSEGSIGASPVARIKGAHAGFDWDTGTVFLKPDRILGIFENELSKRLSQQSSALFKVYRALGQERGTGPSPQDLENARQVLANWISPAKPDSAAAGQGPASKHAKGAGKSARPAAPGKP